MEKNAFHLAFAHFLET